MKLLLDENLPKRLKQELLEHKVFTVRDMRWNGIKNGELINLMIEFSFDALLTFDKNLQFQQNFQKKQIPVLVLNAEDNTFLTLIKLVPKIKLLLNTILLPGTIEVKE